MKIFKESELLSEEYRRSVIGEIESPENEARKRESFKRYEILRDRVKKYIIKGLTAQYDNETVQEMEASIADINFYKKIINKKARVYQTRPEREIKEGSQDDLDIFTKSLKLNVNMKKANRFMEAMQNIGIEILPYEVPNVFVDGDPERPVYKLKINVLTPFFYDVIEDCKNPEIVRAYVKNFYHDDALVYDRYPYERTANTVSSNFRDGDNQQQKIADSPADQDDENNKKYIWWSDSYHFTTNNKGQILDRNTYEPLDFISDENSEMWQNPIGKIPAVFDGKNQDYSFWSVGGEDIVNSVVLLNHLLTEINFVTAMQGSGLFYYFGKGIPKTFKVGPNRAITHEIEDGDPTPQVGFANPSPNLAEMRSIVQDYMAYLLSTNDLEPTSISNGMTANNVTSGIQEMIQRSEPTNAIEDEHERYRDLEPELVRIAGLWAELYKETNQLDPLFNVPSDMSLVDYSITFPKPAPYVSEKEKIDVIALKLKNKLIDEISAYMQANEGITEEQARQAILEMKAERLIDFTNSIRGNNEQSDQETDDQRSEEDQEQDDQE